MYEKLSKEVESRRKQCSKELGRQLKIVVGIALPTGFPNIVQRNCSLQICYAVTLPTKAAADKAVSALPERLLGSGWSSEHGVHAETAQRSLPATCGTLGIALFCSAISFQYHKLLAPYPSASSISSGLTVSSYSSLLNERHNGSHLYQFFLCETAEL